jgi:hypothetical protein
VTSKQPCHKTAAAAYTGQHGHRRSTDRQQYVEWASNPMSPVFQQERKFYASDSATNVINNNNFKNSLVMISNSFLFLPLLVF